MSDQAATAPAPGPVPDGRRLSEDVLANWLHWVLLIMALGVLVLINRHRWFNGDDWGPLVDRKLFGGAGTNGLFVPHNDHWIFFPALADRVLFSIFGVRTYLPYSVLVIFSHLVVVQLLWMLLRRLGVTAWVTFAAIAGFIFLGVGYENIINELQVVWIWPLAAGLGALLIVPATGSWRWRRDTAVTGLLVFAIACSSIGLVMVAVVALVQLLRRGWRVAAATAAAPLLIYLAWYVTDHQTTNASGQLPAGTAIQKLPAFVWAGITGPISTTLELSGIGVVVVVLLAVWTIRHARPLEEPWPIALSLALGAVLFLAMTGLARVQFGPDAAATSRYAYISLALLLPLGALAVDALLHRVPLRAWIILAAVPLLIGVGASQVKQEADKQGAIEREQETRIVAAARLGRTMSEFLVPFPVPYAIPVLTMARLHALDTQGQLPNVATTPADELTALEYLQVFLGLNLQLSAGRPEATIVGVSGATVAPTSRAGCVDVTATSGDPTVTVALAAPASIPITPQRSGSASIVLRRAGASGRVRRFTSQTDPNAPDVVGGRTVTLNVAAPGAQAVIGIPSDGTTTMCNVGLG